MRERERDTHRNTGRNTTAHLTTCVACVFCCHYMLRRRDGGLKDRWVRGQCVILRASVATCSFLACCCCCCLSGCGERIENTLAAFSQSVPRTHARAHARMHARTHPSAWKENSATEQNVHSQDTTTQRSQTEDSIWCLLMFKHKTQRCLLFKCIH